MEASDLGYRPTVDGRAGGFRLPGVGQAVEESPPPAPGASHTKVPLLSSPLGTSVKSAVLKSPLFYPFLSSPQNKISNSYSFGGLLQNGKNAP